MRHLTTATAVLALAAASALPAFAETSDLDQVLPQTDLTTTKSSQGEAAVIGGTTITATTAAIAAAIAVGVAVAATGSDDSTTGTPADPAPDL